MMRPEVRRYSTYTSKSLYIAQVPLKWKKYPSFILYKLRLPVPSARGGMFILLVGITLEDAD